MKIEFSQTWTEVCGEEELTRVSKRVLDSLQNLENFCLWLKGDLGAGKTAFTQSFLHQLGLAKNIPVLSPTYTYMTEYQISGKLYCHMDLYRLPQDDEDSLEQLLAGRDHSHLIVEWPEKCPNASVLAPTAILQIGYRGNSSREYQFSLLKS